MSGKKSASADPVRVLYDGWPLSEAAGDPQAALHLLELLEARPDNIEPWLALPGAPGPDIGANFTQHVLTAPEPSSPAGRLRWEQFRLPGLARQIGAGVIHTTSISLPLSSPAPCVVSPLDWPPPPQPGPGITRRLQEALGQGGLSGAACLLWPEDLPAPQTRAPVLRLPLYVHPAFCTPQTAAGSTGTASSIGAVSSAGALPEAPFILAPGPWDVEGISLLAAVWSWVAAGLDEEWLLLVSDLPPADLALLHKACKTMGIPEERYQRQVRALDLHGLPARAAACQQARVVLQVNRVRLWGDALLQAMACGKPIAGVETPWADARVGPTGYLSPASDPRGLGAAVLTLVVEEDMAERLGRAALQRAASWRSAAFSQALGEIYARVARQADQRRVKNT